MQSITHPENLIDLRRYRVQTVTREFTGRFSEIDVKAFSAGFRCLVVYFWLSPKHRTFAPWKSIVSITEVQDCQL